MQILAAAQARSDPLECRCHFIWLPAQSASHPQGTMSDNEAQPGC